MPVEGISHGRKPRYWLVPRLRGAECLASRYFSLSLVATTTWHEPAWLSGFEVPEVAILMLGFVGLLAGKQKPILHSINCRR